MKILRRRKAVKRRLKRLNKEKGAAKEVRERERERHTQATRG